MAATGLARVVSRMVAHNFTGYRYAASGVLSSVQVPFKLRQFSADVKRKTAAYDRMGVTCSEDYLRTGEVFLQAGDYVVYNQGELLEEYLMVSKLVQDNAVFPGGQRNTQWSVEAYHCNALVDFTTVVTTEDPDTGKLTDTITSLFGTVRCSINSAEVFYSEPNNEPLDEYFLRFPSVLQVPENADVGILEHPDTSGKFQHGKYVIKYLEPDTIGVTSARVGISPTGV